MFCEFDAYCFGYCNFRFLSLFVKIVSICAFYQKSKKLSFQEIRNWTNRTDLKKKDASMNRNRNKKNLKIVSDPCDETGTMIPKKKDATMFREPRFNKIKKVLSQSSEIRSARHESRPIRPTRPSCASPKMTARPHCEMSNRSVYAAR